MFSEKELAYRIGYSDITATQAWDPAGNLQDLGCRLDRQTLSQQVEYGYSYYYTLFGAMTYGDVRCDPAHKRGLGDFLLGVRGRLNPYLNFRTWEVNVTIPSHHHKVGVAQIGCGVYGVGANVDRTDEINDYLSASYGAGVKAWQAPLAHQFNAAGSLSGPFGDKHYTDWSWLAGATYLMPLTSRPTDPVAAANNCGTQARVVRVTPEVHYGYSRNVSVGCGYEWAVWGKDVARGSGFSCSWSYLWQ